MNHDLTRQILLAGIGATFALFFLWALVRPNSLAKAVGARLESKNGISEFHAIYVGIFFAQAALCGLAAWRVEEVLLGDLVALFVLSQPVGRLVGIARNGFPTGLLRFLFSLEAISGILLLMVRPTVLP